MKNRKGIVLMLIGLLLMLAALFLAFCNFEEEREAGEASVGALNVIDQRLQAVMSGEVSTGPSTMSLSDWTQPPASEDVQQATDAPEQPMDDRPDATQTAAPDAAGTPAADVHDAQPTAAPAEPTAEPTRDPAEGIEVLVEDEPVKPGKPTATPVPTVMPITTPVVQLPEVPDYVAHPDMEMPELEVDGQYYIGVLTIPSLQLQLPVISRWSYPKLKIAPCRYQGSVYKDDLVLLAHNYATHFGRLRELNLGDEVSFTDMAGNTFVYEVAEMVNLQPTQLERIVNSDYPLTLFTCTPGGQLRLTVRCQAVKKDEGFPGFSN